jgi:hypothetical protein
LLSSESALVIPNYVLSLFVASPENARVRRACRVRERDLARP